MLPDVFAASRVAHFRILAAGPGDAAHSEQARAPEAKGAAQELSCRAPHALVCICDAENTKLSPAELKGELKEAIESSFGSVEDFKKEFSAAGATQFGSGWAWLVVDGGKLAITKTPNAENPIVSGQTPILTMDVWEHAYYLGAQAKAVSIIGWFSRQAPSLRLVKLRRSSWDHALIISDLWPPQFLRCPDVLS